MFVMRSFISGCATSRCISLLTLPTMFRGVPAGISQPWIPSETRSRPASPAVGTSGNDVERFALVTINARTLPARTIGIAGGPYLGLLGTVIGVMITFAVIAKSGQVEVNSIAPGIAGALLATVAGLAVAIPALFAYSYLSSQIKDAISDMQVFIDEMVTKIAEFYSEPNR